MRIPVLPQSRRGSTILLVLVLLWLLAAFVSTHSVTLYRLSQEVRLIERRQLRRLEVAPRPAGFATNAPPAVGRPPGAAE